MRILCAAAVVVGLLAEASSGADLGTVAGLYKAGRVDEARQALRAAVFTDDHFGWEYWSLKLTPAVPGIDARARDLAEFAPDADRRCDLALLVANADLVRGQHTHLNWLRSIEKNCQSAQDYDRLCLAIAQIEIAADDHRNAEKRLRRLAKSTSIPEINWQALLALARSHMQRGADIEAMRILAQFVSRPENPCFAEACDLAFAVAGRNEWQEIESQAAAVLAASAPRFAALAGVESYQESPTLTVAFAAPTHKAARSLAQLFAIRVGEFDREADARRLHSRLLKQGYTVRLGTAPAGAQARFVVDVGRFPSAADAQRFKQRYERQTQKTCVVVAL